MVQYYRLFLNCARVKDKSMYNDCGFIEVAPINNSKVEKGFFKSKTVAATEYVGKYYIIAVAKKNCFKEVLLGKNVEYDRNGLRDITDATMEELEENLSFGLSCSGFELLDEEVALFYINQILDDPKALEKYKTELNELENKENVKQEILKRKELSTIDDKNDESVKTLKKTRKSA